MADTRLASVETDVLFITPGERRSVYQQLGDTQSAIEPPIMACLLAAYARNKGLTVDILDAQALDLSAQNVADRVCLDYKPILVVMVVYGFQPSASTQNMAAAGTTCKAIKQRNRDIPILMLGTHPAALPWQTMKEEAIDFVCDGEGGPSIVQLVRALKGNESRLDCVPNLWFRQGEEIGHTARGALSENLDTDMPMPAWDLLPMHKYRAHNWHCFEDIDARQPYASIYTSLGCPFKCSFCCINAPFGKPGYRTWSADTIGKQIDELVNRYQIRNIKIADEMFVLKGKHVNDICDQLIRRNYNLNIWAYARIDTVKEEYLEKLARAGFRWLALGIESGNSVVRTNVDKGKFSTGDIIGTIRSIQSAGINVIGNYIFGLPEDTLETMQQTLDLALEANCEFANFYCAMAYPGSRLYDEALTNNIALPESWLGFSQHSYNCLPLPTKTVSAPDVLKFRDKAFHTYFTSQSYLDLIQRKFGSAVIDHIKSMTSMTLERKYC